MLFAQKWFLTLFTYNVAFSKVIRILDIFFNEGWKVIFRVSIFLLKNSEGMKEMKHEGGGGEEEALKLGNFQLSIYLFIYLLVNY